jgi:hypothetical protein
MQQGDSNSDNDDPVEPGRNSTGELAKLAESFLGTVPQDVLGIFGADWLHDARVRNRNRLRAKTREILKQRRVKSEDRVFNPSAVVPILAAAQDRTDDNLLEFWSRLLATSVAKSTTHLIRNLYIDILKQLDPLDARVLLELFKSHPKDTKWSGAHTALGEVGAEKLAKKFGLSYDQIIVSFEHLSALGCVKRDWYGEDSGSFIQATFIGDGLRTALMPDRYPPQKIGSSTPHDD